MTLNQISNTELLSRMQKLVRTERKITHLVLLYIAEIEFRKIYADQGYDGIYSYLTKELGYSEGAAYRRMQAARLLRQVPTVAKKLENGALNLSQLTQVQKCLNDKRQQGETLSEEQTIAVLQKLEHQNTFATQKTLAREMDLPIEVSEKIRPQQNETVRLELTFTSEQFAELETAKSLLSHVCPNGTWTEVITTLVQKFTHQKLKGKTQLTELQSISEISKDSVPCEGSPCPLTLATKDKDTCQKEEFGGAIHESKSFRYTISNNFAVSSTQCDDASKTPNKQRKSISTHLKRKLFQNANYQCEYRDSKTKRQCASKYQLEIEHCQALALGGNNDPKNLRIYCKTHNALAARRSHLFY